LSAIDDDVAGGLRTIAQLEESEREALERRDKVALDVAWRGRETESAKLRDLDARRAAVYAALVRRMEPELEAWRERCGSTVASWREEDQEQTETVERGLRQIESLVWTLMNRGPRRQTERQHLLDEFDALAAKVEPVPVVLPDLDWSVPPVVLRDLVTRLESILEILRRPDVEHRLSSE
jgi:hypothetical protein